MNERTALIRDRLIEKGNEFLLETSKMIPFTRNPAADALLNDLDGHPHAYVIACIMDRQITAERAWLIPHTIGQRIGGFDFGFLASQPVEAFVTAMRDPSSLHRYPDIMAKNLHSAVQKIDTVYDGDASRIWRGTPPSAALVRRFLEFDGAGPKIATMAANILVREFRIPVSDRYSIDISVDTHILRVLSRLGLVGDRVTPEILIYTARELNPEYPGIFDLPAWYLGRGSCRPVNPDCTNCYMADLCEYRATDVR